MTPDQIIISVILLGTMIMFLFGRWRHDMVAAAALLACVFTGLLPGAAAFSGFGHPAVITVACVLILSRALQTSGAVDALARRLLPDSAGALTSTVALTSLAAILSAFMNNVGALALLMPVAIQAAARRDFPPGRILMPVAFGSILGGTITLIGTPPNLIVAGFRAQAGMDSFSMFDFTPVGLTITAVGVAFITLLGWRLVPVREGAGSGSFETGAYLTEVRIKDKSRLTGMSLSEAEVELAEADAQITDLIRNEVRLIAPNPRRRLQAGDILLIEADPESLAGILRRLGLELEEAQKKHSLPEQTADGETTGDADSGKEVSRDEEDIKLMELAVLPQSSLERRSATDIRLRDHYGINLLAVSRQGRRSTSRLRTMTFKAGDVLLMQGGTDAILEFAGDTGCVPLAERALYLPDRRRMIAACSIMAAAISAAAFSLLPATIAFTAGVLALMVFRVVPIRTIYNAVDWPVIVLLAAMIPVAGVIESTGAAGLIASLLLDNVAQGHAVAALVLILVVTMFLSDVINNAATAAVMCPIVISTAAQLGVNPDPFLMAVAVGASCAFLTPIGHQNNTLILGPGGFRFGDYWRLGLPLELLVLATGIPVLLLVFPF